jgi:hypothetical protein
VPDQRAVVFIWFCFFHGRKARLTVAVVGDEEKGSGRWPRFSCPQGIAHNGFKAVMACFLQNSHTAFKFHV